MDVVGRFSKLMAGPVGDVRLDQACLLVAAAVEPGADIAGQLDRLDGLAARVPSPTLPDVVHQLFRVDGFAGDRHAYYDPRNSLLPHVLDRRLGIPITLSIVTIEVARRLGLELAGVGMPGHFLVTDPRDPDTFVDPFSGGVILDGAACRRLFAQLHGDDVAFDDAYLHPVDARAVMARVLANLKHIYRSSAARGPLVETLRLRAAIPGVGPLERIELGDALANGGRFDEAAAVLETAAAGTGAEEADRLRSAAIRLRARLN